jgi:hypothetical protein
MGEAEPTWKDYAQAFSDVVEALDRVDQFMREQHFTTLDLFRGETGDREVWVDVCIWSKAHVHGIPMPMP